MPRQQRPSAADLNLDRKIELRGHVIDHARVFSAVPKNAMFWYANSIGLVEIAANQASAAALIQATVGDRVCLLTP